MRSQEPRPRSGCARGRALVLGQQLFPHGHNVTAPCPRLPRPHPTPGAVPELSPQHPMSPQNHPRCGGARCHPQNRPAVGKGHRAPLVCAGRCASSGGSVPHARCQAMPVIAFQGGNVAPPVPPAVVSCLAQGTPVPPGPAASQPPPPAPNHPKSAQITPSLLTAGKCPSLTLFRSLRRDKRPDLGPPGPA